MSLPCFVLFRSMAGSFVYGPKYSAVFSLLILFFASRHVDIVNCFVPSHLDLNSGSPPNRPARRSRSTRRSARRRCQPQLKPSARFYFCFLLFSFCRSFVRPFVCPFVCSFVCSSRLILLCLLERASGRVAVGVCLAGFVSKRRAILEPI